MVQTFGSSVYTAGWMGVAAVALMMCLLLAGTPRPPMLRDRIVAVLLFVAAALNVPALVWLLKAQGEIRAAKSMHLPVSVPPPHPSHWIIWAMIASLTAVFTVLVMPTHQRTVPSFLFAALAGELGAIGVMRNLSPREEATSATVVLCAVAMLVSLMCFAIKRLRQLATEQRSDHAGPSLPPVSVADDVDAAFGPDVQAVFGAYGEYDREHDGPDCG